MIMKHKCFYVGSEGNLSTIIKNNKDRVKMLRTLYFIVLNNTFHRRLHEVVAS